MLLILGLVNFYIGYHGWLLIDEWFSGVSSAVFWTLFILIAFAYVIGMIPWPKSVKPIARFFKVIGSYYLACMEFAIITLPLADLLYVILGWSGIDRTYYRRSGRDNSDIIGSFSGLGFNQRLEYRDPHTFHSY